MTDETADVVVVGLGAVGSAVLHSLARQGVRAVGIDRFHPPHDRGSSHGESRITRLAVGEGAAYAPLVRRSHAIWRELEAESGETLFLQTGGLIMGPREGAARHHGKDNFVRRTIAVAAGSGVAHEVLDAAEIAARYPQFALQGDELGCFEPTAGVLFPERCIAVQLRLAAAHGARLHLGETVAAIAQHGNTVMVTTGARRIQASRAVLTAGPWLPGLAGGRMAEVAQVYRQTLHWFAVDDAAAYAPDRFPVFIWIHGDSQEDYVYGFPALPGTEAVKVASERYAATSDPDTVDRTVGEDVAAAIYRRHVETRLRGVGPDVVRSAACLYTVTPDAGFVVDTLPGRPAVLAASACSGHGFKHSAALGEAIAGRVLHAGDDAGPFGIARFAPSARRAG